jgi:hypothetical protein
MLIGVVVETTAQSGQLFAAELIHTDAMSLNDGLRRSFTTKYALINCLPAACTPAVLRDNNESENASLQQSRRDLSSNSAP